MDKIEVKKTIKKIFDYIDNYDEKVDLEIYKGHPSLYFFHTKEELNKKIDTYLQKDNYDKYDVYYIIRKLIKFLLDKYDSHTRIFFQEYKRFFIVFKEENNKLHVTNVTDCFNDVLGGELISINGIPIKIIIKELEQIICYSTNAHLFDEIELALPQPDILKSLPSVDSNSNEFYYEILVNGKSKIVTFIENKKYNVFKSRIPENYTYEIKDDILIIHYNSCNDNEKMLGFVEQIKEVSKNNNIEYYIVDLRYNRGGNSDITESLLEFLTDKKIVTLVNERVFSSGAMAMIDLKKMGSYIIGTDIGTSLSYFGNVPGQLNLESLGLTVKRSNTYWYYDKNLELSAFFKNKFYNYFKDKKELLEPVLFRPDEYVYNTIEDIINNNDSQMNRAIEYIKNLKVKKY